MYSKYLVNQLTVAVQRLDVLGQLGGTPSYLLKDPKDHLVEKASLALLSSWTFVYCIEYICQKASGIDADRFWHCTKRALFLLHNTFVCLI